MAPRGDRPRGEFIVSHSTPLTAAQFVARSSPLTTAAAAAAAATTKAEESTDAPLNVYQGGRLEEEKATGLGAAKLRWELAASVRV